ncbi:MAG: peptidylprolyl isomerase [Elsteraceae bacterium]
MFTRIRRLLAASLIALGFASAAQDVSAQTPIPPPDPENTLVLTTRYGDVVIRMRPDLAPNHVARIKELTRQKYYDGVPFHRVIDGFMAQTGDGQFGNGTGGSGKKLNAEFSAEPHVRGIVSMARTSDPNSGDSQFFIMFTRYPSLDRQYTVWGNVVSGMEFVDRIKKGSGSGGAVMDPDKIITMRVQADVK